LASEWRLSLFNQEAVAKQIQSLQGQNPLALQHHESYPPGYCYDPITGYTYHVTESSQAILCKANHPFTKLVDIKPLRRLEYLDPISGHLQPESHTPPQELAHWRFTQLESPQVTTSSTPKVEVSLRLNHTPEIEYQSTLLLWNWKNYQTHHLLILIQIPTAWLEIKNKK